MRAAPLLGTVLAAFLAVTPSAVAPSAASAPATSPTATASEGPTGAAGAAGSEAAEPEGGEANAGVRVVLESVMPAVLVPGSTLAVRATVHNATAVEIARPVVQLRVRSQRSATRSSLDRWVAGRNGRGSERARVALPEPLAPGASRTVDLSVPADDLGLTGDPEQWGPRGLSVEVHDAEGLPAATARSFAVWMPGDGPYQPTRVSVLVPLTDGAPSVATGSIPPEDLAEQTGPGGRLSEVLDTASVPGVTWALDPALLAPLEGPGTSDDGPDPTGTASPTPSAGTSPPTTTTGSPTTPAAEPDAADAAGTGESTALDAWRAELTRRAATHEVVSLPYGDPDLNALAHAGLPEVYELAEERGRDTVQQRLRSPARTDVAWPVTGSLDEPALRMLVAAGRNSVVLSSGAHPVTEELSSTPTGRSRIRTGQTFATGLLVDTSLSRRLAAVDDAQPVPDLPTPDAGSQADDESSQEDTGPVGDVQRLLAETAAITLERPFDPRHVLVAAPRDWDPGPTAGTRAVQALTTAPWVEARPLGDLVATPAPDVARGELRYPEEDRAAELPAEGLRQAAGALQAVRVTATALDDPEAALASAQRSVVAASASAWRAREPQWRDQIEAFAQAVRAQAGAVSVLQGSGITVVSSNVRLPVTVRNDLDEGVTVQVRLQPRSSRLVADEPVTVQVPARSQRRVSVPVKAVGNGNTDVTVELLTPGGERLGEPVTMTVRVRADWETRGTLVLGVVVGLVLVVGLARGIRRGRRQRELQDPVAELTADHAEEHRT